MQLDKITFPLYKLRSYLSIEDDLLGRVIVTTIKGKYILDDHSYNGSFQERRLRVAGKEPNKIYRLKEEVIYLRQLIKYKSGTTFIDYNGVLVKYKKGNRLYKINSHKIIDKREQENWTVIYLENIEMPFLVGNL